jgi:hypothetical protein
MATVKPPQPQLKPNHPKTGKLVSNYVPQASAAEGLNPHSKPLKAENRNQTPDI